MMSLLDNIFVNLRIISKIEEHGRIVTTTPGQVKLEKDNYTTTVRRTFSRDSRSKTIRFLAKLIDNVTEISDSIINSLVIEQNQKTSSFKLFQLNENSKKYHNLNKLVRELENSKKGILNLHATYTKDANATSKLEEIIDNIDIQINKIETALNIFNKSRERDGNRDGNRDRDQYRE